MDRRLSHNLGAEEESGRGDYLTIYSEKRPKEIKTRPRTTKTARVDFETAGCSHVILANADPRGKRSKRDMKADKVIDEGEKNYGGMYLCTVDNMMGDENLNVSTS